MKFTNVQKKYGEVIRNITCLLLVFMLNRGSHAEDRYAPVDARMPQGPFQGSLVDVREKRPLVILSPEEAAAYGPAEGEIVVANIYHEGRFWIGKIPVQDVEDVYFHHVAFKSIVPAAHVEVMFRFKPGHEVSLFPQDGGGQPKRSALRDLIFSTEAVEIPGGDYNVVQGLFNHFGKVTRVMSPEEVYAKWVMGSKAKLEQIRIHADAESKRHMLANAIRTSAESGLDKMYNTVCASCVTDAFSWLDHGNRYRLLNGVGSLLHVLPIFPRTYLLARGLIPLAEWWRNPTPDFNDEFTHLAGDPDLIQHARESKNAFIRARLKLLKSEKAQAARRPSLAKRVCSFFFGLLKSR